MIVKNEEKHIEKCLNSAKNFVDEIIIVDTGSSDKTREIAKKFTDKIFEFNWVNDFSKARNFSISKASSDWILVLDGDETIEEIDFKKLKALIETENDAAYMIHRNYTNDYACSGFISIKESDYSFKEAEGFFDVKIIRLFRNDPHYVFDGIIHETPDKSIFENSKRISNTSLVIHHFGNLDKNLVAAKKNSYIDLLRERVNNNDFQEKTEDYVLFELASELMRLGRFSEAESYLIKANTLVEKPEYLLQLGGLYIHLKKLDLAERVLIKASNIKKSFDACNNLGIVYAMKKEYNRAVKKFQDALDINPNDASIYMNFANLYKEMGKKDKQQFYLEKYHALARK